jgi:hypothetical protein
MGNNLGGPKRALPPPLFELKKSPVLLGLRAGGIRANKVVDTFVNLLSENGILC